MMCQTVWIINHCALTPAQGGLSRHFYFAKEMISRGYKVRIFTSSTIHNTDINMIQAEDNCFFKDVEYDGVNYTYLKSLPYRGNGLSRIRNMLGFASSIKKIWKKYSWEKPDIIYTSSPDIFTAWKAEKFAKKHQLPCLVEVRDLWPLSIVEYKGFSNRHPAIRFLYGLEKKIYRRADALIFTMEGGKDYIQEKGWGKKVRSDKIFNVNNGIDVQQQLQQRAEFQIDDEDLRDESSFKVIYAGSIRNANSVGLIVKAAELLEENTDICFFLYGDGDDRFSLEETCKSLGLENIKFKGKVDKKYIPYICSKASVNILTYKNVGTWKYGGSQNKIFDYLNAGKPVIANIEMGYSLLKRYACGIELGSDSPEVLAAAILELYNLPDDQYELMCQSAAKAARDFDYKFLTDKLETAISYAIEHKRRK